MGTLYLVSTPIGNLEDITLRALRVLKEVDLIACEDTRVTKKLLDAHGIETPTRAYHAHSDPSVTEAIVAELVSGRSIAVVSDAGTPILSDPGAGLVEAAIAAGVTVVPIPGPSALLSALVASGLPVHPFVFLGFLPKSDADRARVLSPLAGLGMALVIYEATSRLADTLRDLEKILGDRKACVGRELTKKFEELARGPLSELAAHFADGAKGEAVIVVGPGQAAESSTRAEDAKALIERMRGQGERTAEIAKAVAATFGMTKQEAYLLVLSQKPAP